MKILVLGNSQASSLLIAYHQNFARFRHLGLSFYVTPGAGGPHITFSEDGRPATRVENPEAPAYFWPDETPSVPLSDYDAILVSALGFVDGGFAFPNEILRQGLLHAFEPYLDESGEGPPLVSSACFVKYLNEQVRAVDGIQLLGALRSIYSRPIFVQPFPHLSEIVAEQDAWQPRRLYRDFLGMNRFVDGVKDEMLADLARQHDVEILPYPAIVTADRLTPATMMRADGFHPTEDYSLLVLERFAERLERAA